MVIEAGPRILSWAVSYRLAVGVTLAAAPPAKSFRCRARCPASAPAPVINPPSADAADAPYGVHGQAPCAAGQDAVDCGQRPGDGQELRARRAGHSGMSGGGRRDVWAFSGRPSAAVR